MSWRNKKLRLPKGMREFPKEATDLSPEKVVKMYNDGFAGIKIDPEAKEELMESQAVPDGDTIAMSTGMAESGKGKLSIPFTYVTTQYPKVLPGHAQETGNCHPRWVKVRMANGTTKRIEDIRVGDKVVSAKGNICRVSKLIKKSEGQADTMCYVSFQNDIRKLPLTPDHKVLTVVDKKRVWKEAGKLKPGDKVLRPNPCVKVGDREFDLASYYTPEEVITEDEPLETRRMPAKPGCIRALHSKLHIPRYIKLDERLAWLVGLYAAEGSMDYENDKPSRVSFNFGTHRIAHALQAKEYLEKIFKIKCHLYPKKGTPTVTCLRIQNVLIAGLFSHLVPGNVYDKKVNDLFFASRKDIRLALLRGWMDGDGHITKSGTMTAVSVSSDLIGSMIDLCTSCRIGISSTRIVPEREGHVEAYYIDTPSKPIWGDGSIVPVTYGKTDDQMRLAGTLCPLKDGTPAIVKTVEFKGWSDEVFCLEVESDHSFIADGFASHNCVGKMTKNVTLVLYGVECALQEPDEETGEIEGWLDVPLGLQKEGIFEWETKYGERGHAGQGASCSRLILVLTKSSGVIVRKDYPEVGVDFTKENTQLSISWGRRGVPENILALGKDHPIRNAADVPDHEVARDFIHNGYPIGVCSDLGFSDTCDSNGYASRRGSWGHSWIVAGYDDRPETIKAYGFPLFLFIHDWGCHSDDTEVLTKRGWLLFQDLEMDDEIATLNQETHHLEYQNPTKLFEYDFNGYLWNYTSKGCGVDLLVTSNHNMYYCKVNKDKSDPSNWEISQAENMICHTHFKKDALWVGEEIPVKELGEYRIPMNDWLEFLGIFIGDGSTTLGHIVRKRALPNGKTRIDRYKQYIVSISRKTLEKDKQIQEIIDRMPFKMGIGKNAWSKNSKLLFNELRSLGKAANKHIPDYVMDLPPEQLQHLYKGMMLTDGSLVQTETGPRETYFTGSAILADQFQEMLLKMGGSGSVSITDRRGKDNGTGGISRLLEFRVGIRWKSLNPKPSKGWKPILVPYKGKVYCAEVPNHLMYVRRNGKPVWSGNSWNNNKKGILIRDTNILIPPGSFWADARLLDQCDMTALSGLKGFKKQMLPDLGGTTWG